MAELLVKERPLWEQLVHTKKPIVLYGMGNGADKVILEMVRRGIALAGVFASDGFVRGQVFHGHKVVTYGAAKEIFGDMVVLVAFGTHLEAVVRNIQKIAGEQELYIPDVEVAGGDAFTWEFYETHKSKFNEAYAMLADEESRNVFSDLLNYKVSGKLPCLMKSICGCGLFSMEELQLGQNEVYVDAGAYDGDTVGEFVEAVQRYEKIYALEPDGKSFQKLLKNMGDLMRCECIRVAADREDGMRGFSQNAGRQSHLDANTKKMTHTCTIDRFAPDATCIKLDVEGNEFRALQGAEAVIRTNKPKLLVSAYHRNEDLFTLPLLVQSMRPDYKVYLRRYYSVPAWDMVYYFV